MAEHIKTPAEFLYRVLFYVIMFFGTNLWILAVYWITAILGYLEITLIQFLLCMSIKNFELFITYYKQVKSK